MVRPEIDIPIFEDIKCLKTLKEEGKSVKQMAEYYDVSDWIIRDRLKKHKLV